MAPFFLWPVLFLTLPVLVWLIDGAQCRKPKARSFWQRPAVRAATAGWWFGFGYFLFGLFWIGEAFLVEADKFAWLLPFAVTLMPAGLALFHGACRGRGAARLAAGTGARPRARHRAVVVRSGCAATSSPAFPGTCSATR